jgi:Leucine-rich repeat (LRR) protein
MFARQQQGVGRGGRGKGRAATTSTSSSSSISSSRAPAVATSRTGCKNGALVEDEDEEERAANSVQKEETEGVYDLSGKSLEVKDVANAMQMWNRPRVVLLAGNRLDHLPLGPPPCIMRIDISKCGLKTLDGFCALPHLEFLDASYNELSSCIGLASNRCLQFLQLGNNRIRRVEGLEMLKLLERIDLSYNRLRTSLDIRPLSLNACLSELCLEGNPICATQAGQYRLIVRHLLPQAKLVAAAPHQRRAEENTDGRNRRQKGISRPAAKAASPSPATKGRVDPARSKLSLVRRESRTRTPGQKAPTRKAEGRERTSGKASSQHQGGSRKSQGRRMPNNLEERALSFSQRSPRAHLTTRASVSSQFSPQMKQPIWSSSAGHQSDEEAGSKEKQQPGLSPSYISPLSPAGLQARQLHRLAQLDCANVDTGYYRDGGDPPSISTADGDHGEDDRPQKLSSPSSSSQDDERLNGDEESAGGLSSSHEEEEDVIREDNTPAIHLDGKVLNALEELVAQRRGALLQLTSAIERQRASA